MIRHIVLFSAKDKGDIPAILAGLRLLGAIPQARNFSVSENLKSDPLSSEADIVVYAEFENETALTAYRASPVYAESVRLVRPLRDMRMSVDFEA